MPLIDPVRRLWQAIPSNSAKNVVRKVVRSALPVPFPPSYVAELRLLDVVDAGVSEDHLPYVVAIVQLDDGPRILGAMLGLDRAPEIGMRVRPGFLKIDEEQSILVFEPAT